MAEEALKARRTAKCTFTRKKNKFYSALAREEDFDSIKGIFDELTYAWSTVEGKHEFYTMLLEDEKEVDASEPWITELQGSYDEAESLFKKRARENAIKEKEEKTRATYKKLTKRQASLDEVFDTSINRIMKLFKEDESKISISILRKNEQELAKLLESCQLIHDEIIELPLEYDHTKLEIDWIREKHTQCANISNQIELLINNQKVDTRAKEETKNHVKESPLRMEKVKLPSFGGNIKEYPQFKADFTKHVMPTISEANASYVLRSCLTKEPLERVKNVDDDLMEMWTRLDEKYGDPAKVTDVIISEIQHFKNIKEGDTHKLLQFIDMIENGYRDLKRLGFEQEITTTSSVSIIERKLPENLQDDWAKIISSETDQVDRKNKFPALLKFLLSRKKAIEYKISELRAGGHSTRGSANYTEFERKTDNDVRGQRRTVSPKCTFHDQGKHWTSDCRLYLSKPVEERQQLLKDKKACWSCLKPGHRIPDCRRKRNCGVNRCTERHHPTLHNETKPSSERENVNPSNTSASATVNVCNDTNESDACLLQIQRIPSKRGWLNVMWDNGASLCFITNAKAKAEKLKGTEVQLTLVKVGGTNEIIKSQRYFLSLFDKEGREVKFAVYGIDKITSDLQRVNINGITKLFKHVPKEDLIRPTGTVDVLIGYEYAAYHPTREQNIEHLVLLKNRFGRCIGGTHPSIQGLNNKRCFKNLQAHSVRVVKIEDFYNIENLGIDFSPKCGNCKCGNCATGSKNCTIKEEKELKLIEQNLEYDANMHSWTTEYPWIKDPNELPDNRRAAYRMLISTEKRLNKNPQHAEVYKLQIEDMVNREVARKLTKEEIDNYKGPIHYISHHEVLKPDSKSTPVRIVFNSSANYMGHILNDYWAKGPDLLNSLIGVLIRFRENKIAIIGDVKKMYHTIKTKPITQHTHRFLWRDMDQSREPDTYIIQRVSFGDKPSGTIATVAMRKTAEMGKDLYPQAASVVQKNTYMDDIIDSTNDLPSAAQLASDIEKLLINGGFKLKAWTFSGDPSNNGKPTMPQEPHTAEEKVLGVKWNPVSDYLCFSVKLNFSPKKKKRRKQNTTSHELETIPQPLTKRAILSQINSIYDPLGLAGPFTIRAKILMRQVWANNTELGWDDPIPEDYRKKWTVFFEDLIDMKHVTFKRCMKPDGAITDPVLIIFSDGSSEAYGACAYARWQLKNQRFVSQLIVSKNRLAPVRKISVDRIELCGAVLNKRLKVLINEQCRYKFQRCYHVVDSQIVHAMIQKDSYGFNTFAATRIGEIQEGTQQQHWYWTESAYNIADLLTRGKKPSEIGLHSEWQEGPDFLKRPECEWPITRDYLTPRILPDVIHSKVAATIISATSEDLATRIKIEKYSNYKKLLRVTARILSMYRKDPKISFSNAVRSPEARDIKKAEMFWIKECQKFLENDIQKGKLKRLCPRRREDGIFVVGGRGQKWMEMTYNKKEVILLPSNHRFSRLYTQYIHDKGHYGVLTTASKVRSRFWIVKLLNMIKSIKFNCVMCKKLEKKLCQQEMGKLPEERLKPAPPWYSTGIDLFGPFSIRDEVKKRTIGKAYGIIFNCLGTRAVHIDLAPNYSTDKFLMALRRFVSIRGYPSILYSDNGTQLISADKELQKITKGLDWDELNAFGITEGLKWKFTSADAPWQNGVTESLIKSVKKAITFTIGENILTYSELQTVFFESANLINERPIGRHPTSPEDGTYLCPNDLLLGRSTPRIPSGPFMDKASPRNRFEFIQQLTNYFWKKWTRDFFPSLIIRQKWHTAHRNVTKGDIVLLQDSNLVRGQWRLGKVSQVYPDSDGKVRRVEVQYKNPKPGERITKYEGRGYVTVTRPIQRLVVLLPNQQDKSVIP